MKCSEIQKIADSLYGPAVALEKIFPHAWRRRVEILFRVLFIFALGITAILLGMQYYLHQFAFASISPLAFGVSCLLFCVWIVLYMLEAFYYSYYFLDPKEIKGTYISFELALDMLRLSQRDIVASFFALSTGRLVLLRCGVTDEAFKNFLKSRTVFLDTGRLECEIRKSEQFALEDFIISLTTADKGLADFLFAYGIQKKEIAGIADWITEESAEYSEQEHWWSWQNMSRVPSIGQNWSYGRIYTIEKYAESLYSSAYRRFTSRSTYGLEELKEMESVLARSREANVLLVGDDDVGKLQIVSNLSQIIGEGQSAHELRNKRVVLLDHDSLIARNGSKIAFETELIQILVEAVNAGNIILVFKDLPSFIASVSKLGSDLPSLLETYFASPTLQIIALSDTGRFHDTIEKNNMLMQHFERVFLKEIDSSSAIKVIENEVVQFENQNLFFTYPAVAEIVESAERYFSDGVMPDKAIDLLLEVVPKLASKGKKLVEKKDILDLIETKTGIPVGAVKTEEKEKLLNLEKILHERIVGQDEAVKIISNAVRRARSGIMSPNRPLGSFLFLGPTGVGKTETTKALADVFFGSEGHITRLDMSEYSSVDSVSKLIGSFDSGQSGVLATALREHPYGVLLLDEFEKTTKEVMNLFLQIIDEGFFSDMSGKKVNARNVIIIATSNAGSDLIWDLVQSGKDLAMSKDTIVDAVIKQGVFKPELLNRFDGVVVFHPLAVEHLRKIAELMLQKLRARLAQKGIHLAVDETLIQFVMKYGTDPKFGARPMNRAIQEDVEELVAKKIIAGSAEQGSEIVFTKEELEDNVGK